MPDPTPMGAEPSSIEPTNPSPSPATVAQGGGPTPIDISDDTLVRGVPGFNEPVRYGDLYKRLQSDYTKKTQAAERLRQQAIQEQTTHRAEIAAERRRLEGLAQTLLARQGTASPAADDALFKELAAAEYIDGPKMGRFIQAMQEKGFTPIVKAFQERDKIIQGLYNQVLQMNKVLSSIQEKHQGADLDGKISRWLSEGGYPQEAADLAKEIYSAYEGDDLDNEFPAIFESRWNQLQTILRAQDRKRVDAAKLGARLPGRGGNGAASKPIGLKGYEKPRDVANALWDAMQVEDQT